MAPDHRNFSTMKILISFALLSGLSVSANAASTVNYVFLIDTPVPDNTGVGFSDTQQITSSITSITGVSVQMAMRGGWAGDMYAYVTHGDGFAVLLNRPGRNLANLAGSGVSEFSIEFADDAPADVHTAIATSGVVSGFFQPDAREIDPDNSLDTSPRTAFLSSFNGLDANGDWTLFVADVSSGDQMTLDGWSLTIQGIPEPTTTLIAALGMAGLLRRRRTS